MKKTRSKEQCDLFDPEAGGFWTEKKVRQELPHVKVKLKSGAIATGVTAGRLNDRCTVWVFSYMNLAVPEAKGQLIKFQWPEIVKSLNESQPLLAG
jgi:hypothetical protein